MNHHGGSLPSVTSTMNVSNSLGNEGEFLKPQMEQLALVQAGTAIDSSVQLALDKSAMIKAKIATLKNNPHQSTNKRWVHAQNFIFNSGVEA